MLMKRLPPLIQYIFDNYNSLIPIASCQGGTEPDESTDCYIFLIVRSRYELNKFCIEFDFRNMLYIAADDDLCNIGATRISIDSLDDTLEKLKQLNQNNNDNTRILCRHCK